MTYKIERMNSQFDNEDWYVIVSSKGVVFDGYSTMQAALQCAREYGLDIIDMRIHR